MSNHKSKQTKNKSNKLIEIWEYCVNRSRCGPTTKWRSNMNSQFSTIVITIIAHACRCEHIRKPQFKGENQLQMRQARNKTEIELKNRSEMSRRIPSDEYDVEMTIKLIFFARFWPYVCTHTPYPHAYSTEHFVSFITHEIPT